MLLVHQSGAVRVGEILRYTLTYTPADDRILPSPKALFIKIKNHRAIPLRAAYLRGPYNIYCAAYPSTFDPYHKHEDQEKYGNPQFEPYLRPGGEWVAKLVVPEEIRETAETFANPRKYDSAEKKSVTWIIEIVSQILFSTSASVSFEMLISRDERSLELGKVAVAASNAGQLGENMAEHHNNRASMEVRSARGIYSKAVKLSVEDTAGLWNRPALPEWEGRPAFKRRSTRLSMRRSFSFNTEPPRVTKQKNIHLVVITHGIHSNTGADMLYLKESIDATVKQNREHGGQRTKKKETSDPPPKTPKSTDSATRDFAADSSQEYDRSEDEFWEGGDNASDDEDNNKLGTILSQDTVTQEPESINEDTEDEATTAPLSGGQDQLDGADEDEDDEQIVVRGFSGNVTLTEKGIQYLGKRLAKSLLEMTYPDQPYRPVKRKASQRLASTFSSQSSRSSLDENAVHAHSSIQKLEEKVEQRAYKYTSISFIGHSLGGLVQLYAIGYIQKHSPEFFDRIKPVNFVAMATPFLGLSNENPIYVKFALDFGLVGRTGQDLGLTWRPPTLVKGLWDAMFQDSNKKKQGQPDPSAKPLLRILPSGPAHQVLKRFKRRTVYSNIVNDGIVPLRTSCLLFLDWKGLEKVDKARRENGLIGTVATWGWQEMTGQNSSPHPTTNPGPKEREREANGHADFLQPMAPPAKHIGSEVPQPAEDVTNADDEAQTAARARHSRLSFEESAQRQVESRDGSPRDAQEAPKSTNNVSALDTFLKFFRFGSPAPKQSQGPQGSPEVARKKSMPSLSRKASQPKLNGKTSRPRLSKKDSRVFRRGQTLQSSEWDDDIPDVPPLPQGEHHIPNREQGEHGAQAHFHEEDDRPEITRGGSSIDDPSGPPKTSFLEAAGDLIAPPLPTAKWINDPESRSKIIFHDRVYRPEDIPPPPTRKGTRAGRSTSSDHTPPSASEWGSAGSSARAGSTGSEFSDAGGGGDPGNMRVEEKIARAYHHDLTWRKVLVKLEPDAHNNMVVRRMFANAYGWPVIKHLCENHFTD